MTRLVDDVLIGHPQSSREQIKRAIADRYRQFCRARDKYLTPPPKA